MTKKRMLADNGKRYVLFLAMACTSACAQNNAESLPIPPASAASAGQSAALPAPGPGMSEQDFSAVTGVVIPDKSPEIADFLAKARAADAIADPLARCLAYPDIPGNHWPAGLAEAHCRALFAPYIHSDTIKKYLANKDAVGLDALFAKDLAKHFSSTDFSEFIHRDYKEIEANPEWDRLTQQWLQLAPDSAFALLARARYFRAMAGEARGEKYANETPDENMRLMSEYADKGIEFATKALQKEPKLMPGYGMLIKLAMMDSRRDVMADAIKQILATDPYCLPDSEDIMQAIEPRWGGSYEAMASYSQLLSKGIDRRPLLANVIVEKEIDLADVMYDQHRPDAAVEVLSPVVLQSTNTEIFSDIARDMNAVDSIKYTWQTVSDLLEVDRFDDARAREIEELVNTSLGIDPEWKTMILKRYLAAHPDEKKMQILLGTVYLSMQKLDDAREQLLLSVNDPQARLDSLFYLMQVEIRQKKIKQAGTYYDALKKEFPEAIESRYVLDPRLPAADPAQPNTGGK